MELTSKEKQTLADILRTEIIETQDLIKPENDEATKKELEEHLAVVISIFRKMKEAR